MVTKSLRRKILKRKRPLILRKFHKGVRKEHRKVKLKSYFRRKLSRNFLKFLKKKPKEKVRRRLLLFFHAKLSRRVRRQLYWYRVIRGRRFIKGPIFKGRIHKYMEPTYHKLPRLIRLRQLQDIYFFRNRKLRAIKKKLRARYTALIKGLYKEKLARFTYKPSFWSDTPPRDNFRRGFAFANAKRIYRRHKFMRRRAVRYAVLRYISSNTQVSKYVRKLTTRKNSYKVRPVRSILLRRRLRRLKFKRLRRYRRLTGRKIRKSHNGLHVVFMETKNNFVISCINEFGELIYYVNASSVGARGRRKRFPYTAELCGKRMRKFLYKNRVLRVSLVIKSRMRKRMKEAIRGFMSQRIRLIHIFLRLPITHNGIRYQKVKRK